LTTPSDDGLSPSLRLLQAVVLLAAASAPIGCGLSPKLAGPGHIPFACEPSIFSIMLDEAGR